ncbi:Tubulin-tyrosine ligase domain containing protein [Trichostrongylus colubriformis]|uniref:Tubulin-tyrosine ligase domain containing protein n=1 Tax=Trichostrongylus colubriformis TaxID=6319 RepID=A0AAN8FAC5_TRICO
MVHLDVSGMVRFCTEKYRKPKPSNFDNLYAHLTNYSLNKGNLSYIHSLSLMDQINGSKRLLSTVFGQMAKCGLRTKKLWHDIKIIIVKTVLAMLPELMINYEYEFNGTVGPQCFQIMGFDIIVREDGTPILLEVNSAPSLTIEHTPANGARMRSIVDEMIKIPLVRDTLLLVTGQLQEPSRRGSPSAHGSSRSTDDLNTFKSPRKPHLSEVAFFLIFTILQNHSMYLASLKIFPNRYGQEAKHLLFVDRAVYIFIQFANLRLSKNISTSSLRRFVRDCGLEKYFEPGELEKLSADISHHYTGDSNNNKGLPFHGFLELLSIISKRLYPEESSLQIGLQKLLNVCASALRNRGVRSQRLRREEVDTKSGSSKKIYMLPSHARHKGRSKSCEPISPVKINIERKADGNNNNVKHVSLPSISRK